MSSVTERACPACAATAATPVARIDLCTPAGHPLGDGYDLVSCARCGTGFADVLSRQSYYDAYYAAAAKYAGEAATEHPGPNRLVAESAVTAARLDGVADRMQALLPDRAARILDVGCANGTLLAALRSRGYAEIVGLDPAPECSRIARAVHGVRVEIGTLSRLPAGLGTFDCVSLIGVLEHLWDVSEALSEVLGLLRPGGMIYLEVPDAARYLDPYVAPYQEFSTEHINHFSPTSLATLAGRLGFDVVETTGSLPELVTGVRCASVATAWRFDGRTAPAEATDDHQLRQVLTGTARRSAADFERLGRRLDDALAGHREYAVWGAGEFTMKLLTLPELVGRELVSVVDANAGRHAMTLRGIRVQDPRHLPAGDVPIIVGSLVSAPAIVAAMSELGLGPRVVSCAYEREPLTTGSAGR